MFLLSLFLKVLNYAFIQFEEKYIIKKLNIIYPFLKEFTKNIDKGDLTF